MAAFGKGDGVDKVAIADGTGDVLVQRTHIHCPLQSVVSSLHFNIPFTNVDIN